MEPASSCYLYSTFTNHQITLDAPKDQSGVLVAAVVGQAVVLDNVAVLGLEAEVLHIVLGREVHHAGHHPLVVGKVLEARRVVVVVAEEVVEKDDSHCTAPVKEDVVGADFVEGRPRRPRVA